MRGTGIENQFGLAPLTNIRIPINTTYTSLIKLRNPTQYPLQIIEIYSSDDDLHLDLPLNIDINKKLITKTKEKINLEFNKNKDNKNLQLTTKNFWFLNSYETREIALLRYMGHTSNNHTAFISLKAVLLLNMKNNQTEKKSFKKDLNELSFILPVEIEVTNRPGVFSPQQMLNFGYFFQRPNLKLSKNFYSASLEISNIVYSPFLNESVMENILNDAERKLNLFLTSTAQTPIEIKDIYSIRLNTALSIHFRPRIILTPSVNHLTKVAEISFFRKLPFLLCFNPLINYKIFIF